MNEFEEKLYKEMVMWRLVGIVLVVLFIVGTAIGMVLSSRWRNDDNVARLAAWKTIQGNQEVIKTMLNDLDTDMNNDRNELRQCANCHTHVDAHRPLLKPIPPRTNQ